MRDLADVARDRGGDGSGGRVEIRALERVLAISASTTNRRVAPPRFFDPTLIPQRIKSAPGGSLTEPLQISSTAHTARLFSLIRSRVVAASVAIVVAELAVNTGVNFSVGHLYNNQSIEDSLTAILPATRRVSRNESHQKRR